MAQYAAKHPKHIEGFCASMIRMIPELLKKIEVLKKQIDARGALPDALQKNLDAWYKVELTYTSNALEGNTLTRQETALLIEKGITPEGKTME